jgi:hypothetical protein
MWYIPSLYKDTPYGAFVTNPPHNFLKNHGHKNSKIVTTSKKKMMYEDV